MLDIIAFDADDTLWHNEIRYLQAKNRYSQLLSRYHNPERAEQRLDEIELQNIRSYGYGIKSFTLSLIEAAIELTEGQVTGSEVQEILDLGREMLTAEVGLFPHAEETVASLSARHDLMLITKGDAFEQEKKVEQSGLGQHFRYVEILGEKTVEDICGLFLWREGEFEFDPSPFVAFQFLHVNLDPGPPNSSGLDFFKGLEHPFPVLERFDRRRKGNSGLDQSLEVLGYGCTGPHKASCFL